MSSMNHTKNLIRQISLNNIENKATNLYDNFENTSIFIKRKEKETLIETALSKNLIEERKNELSKNYLPDELLKETLFNKNPKKAQLQKVNYCVEDTIMKSKLLEWAGIQFTKIEWLKIRESMKKLSNEKVKDMRFWGKIYGKHNDYNIIQVKYKEDRNNIDKYTTSKIHEPRNLEGANNYAFYVSNDNYINWTELPDVTYEQLRVSRLFKYYLSGNLSNKVKSFIEFPGLESHLLKCLVLRITHSNNIVPDGYFEIKQIENSQDIYGIELNDKLIQKKEDFQLQATNEEMMNLEKWIHEYPYIYDNGRIINLVNEESPIPRLQSISNDKIISETTPLWNVKEIGDKMIYTDPNSVALCYSTVILSNYNWPGAKTIYRNGEFTSIYIGDGVRLNSYKYYPLTPLIVESDPVGFTEFKEPNPDKEPEIIESDSDKEPEIDDKQEMD